MSVYINQGLKDHAVRELAERMQESSTGLIKAYGADLLEILDTPVAGTPAEHHLPIDVEPQDMCVHVVLPGGAVLTLANSEPPTPQALEPFGERDKRIMRTLLLAASDELVGPYDYGYSYGVQQPMPAAFPVAPRPVKP